MLWAPCTAHAIRIVGCLAGTATGDRSALAGWWLPCLDKVSLGPNFVSTVIEPFAVTVLAGIAVEGRCFECFLVSMPLCCCASVTVSCSLSLSPCQNQAAVLFVASGLFMSSTSPLSASACARGCCRTAAPLLGGRSPALPCPGCNG